MAREHSICHRFTADPHQLHPSSALLQPLHFDYLLFLQSLAHSSTLLQLFSALPFFIFNALRTLRQKQAGVSVSPPLIHSITRIKMKPKSPSSDFTPERCQHRTRAGRQCRSLVADANSSFCAAHAASEPADSADLVAALTREAYDFQRPQGVNNSLGVLYNLLAEGRICPRRASVLAYISSLLLRTLPAIEYDNEHYTYDDDEPEAQDQTSTASAATPAAR